MNRKMFEPYDLLKNLKCSTKTPCRPIVKLMQTSNGTSQTSSYVSRKSFNINRQVSVVKQGVSIRSFHICFYSEQSV